MASNSSSDIGRNHNLFNVSAVSEFGLENGTEPNVVSYDEILEKLGQMGKFQLRTFLWLCLPAFFPGIVIMSYTFTGGTPNYRLEDDENIYLEFLFYYYLKKCVFDDCMCIWFLFADALWKSVIMTRWQKNFLQEILLCKTKRFLWIANRISATLTTILGLILVNVILKIHPTVRS